MSHHRRLTRLYALISILLFNTGAQAKILGVNISSDLKWNHHIAEVVKKARKRLFCLSQLKRAGLGPNELVQFYRTCIRPITEYACTVFHDGLPVYLSHELEAVQASQQSAFLSSHKLD